MQISTTNRKSHGELYQQYGDDPSVHHMYSTALSKTLYTLPNPLFWNGVDLHTTLKTQVGTSLSLSSTTDNIAYAPRT